MSLLAASTEKSVSKKKHHVNGHFEDDSALFIHCALFSVLHWILIGVVGSILMIAVAVTMIIFYIKCSFTFS